MHVNFDVGEDR